ncbi:MAG: hypothetical protein JW702_05945 [Clostridiales bacterium]|nr:hypothetical protein [Clostridiales bacterium]
MNKTTKMMISMRLIYSIFKSFIFIFVNIYLWKSGNNFQSVAVFNIFNYLGATVSFYLANLIALKNMRFNYIISSMCFLFVFGLTAVLGDSISQYALLIGLLGGFGDGFFFFNLNTFQADELDKYEMDRFMSIIGGMNKASTIITPIVSGIIIEQFGFIFMIYILLALIIIQFVISIKMPNKKIKSMGKIRIKESFGNRAYRKIVWTNLLQTPYSQFSIMANSVFLYSLWTSELVIGFLNALFSVVSIFMFFFYRMMLKKIERKRLMLVGALSSSLVLLLLIKPTLTTFIIFGITLSLGSAFFSTPLVGIQLGTAKIYSDNESEMLGNLILRVILLNIGRIGFFILAYFFYQDFTSPIFIVFLIYNFFGPLLSYQLANNEI